MKLDSSLDHVQLRDGTSLLGRVQNPTFKLKTRMLGTLMISREDIISNIFRSSSTGSEERVILKESTQVFGTIEDDTLDFEDDALGALKVDMAKVLAVQFVF